MCECKHALCVYVTFAAVMLVRAIAALLQSVTLQSSVQTAAATTHQLTGMTRRATHLWTHTYTNTHMHKHTHARTPTHIHSFFLSHFLCSQSWYEWAKLLTDLWSVEWHSSLNLLWKQRHKHSSDRKLANSCWTVDSLHSWVVILLSKQHKSRRAYTDSSNAARKAHPKLVYFLNKTCFPWRFLSTATPEPAWCHCN